MTRSDKFDWGGCDVDDPESSQRPIRGLQVAGRNSIVYLHELKGKRLLFTGDIEPDVAERIAGELKPHLDGNGSTRKHNRYHLRPLETSGSLNFTL